MHLASFRIVFIKRDGFNKGSLPCILAFSNSVDERNGTSLETVTGSWCSR